MATGVTCMIYKRRVRGGLVHPRKVSSDPQLLLEVVQHHLHQEQPGRHVTNAVVVGVACVRPYTPQPMPGRKTTDTRERGSEQTRQG